MSRTEQTQDRKKENIKPETITIDNGIERTTKSVIKAAIEYENRTQRKLGITGEIGEVLVCIHLGLKLLRNSRTEGYDAIDKKGRRVQIKVRRSETGDRVNEGGRISRFSNHEFDYTLLGLLNKKYGLYKLYQVTYSKLEPIIQNEQNEKRGITIKSFLKVADDIF